MGVTINKEVTAHLKEIARLLDEQGANQFRVSAYRRAAETLQNLKRPVDSLTKTGGLEALQQLPGIGGGLARSIQQYVLTGRMPALERLRGESDPIAALASVSGIGARLAERLHSELGITTLEELEAAAHDGRLAEVPGFGKKRIAGVKESLAARLGRGARPLSKPSKTPAVSELLEVDREYREKAGENIARGQFSIEEVIKGWMGSPQHREHLLSSEFADVGFGLAFGRNMTG